MKTTLKEFKALVKSLIEKHLNEQDENQDLDEAEEDHEGDPRWDEHPDPTGKEWHSGLEESSQKKRTT